MSNLFRVKNGLNLSPVDLTTLTSPQAGDLACDINDLNKIKRYDASTLGWTEVGSGGGVGNVNALLTQTFDTVALAQFTQTGLALSTSNPIDGTQSARLIHQPATSQSFKQVIDVDRKYRGELMQLSMQVRSSASNGNLTLLVTDETNSATIAASQSISTGSQTIASLVTNATTTVSGFSNSVINGLSVGMTVTGSGIATGTLISAINTTALTITLSQAATASATVSLNFSALPDRRTFSFIIPANCASMSYTITALQEANLPESYIDDVVIELASTALLSTSVDVPNMTAWNGYTPTFQGFGTPTNVEFEWRQVGENVEIRGKFTAGTTTAVEARVGLPAGLTSAGTGLIPSIQAIGAYFIGVTTANDGGSVLVSPSTNYINISSPAVFNSGTVNALSPALGSSIGTSDIVSFFASIPCAGLSATSTKTIALTQSGLVQEADSSVRFANNASGAAGFGTTTFSSIWIKRFSTLISNIGDAISVNDSAANGTVFTATKNGFYSVNFFHTENSGIDTAIFILVDSSNVAQGRTGSEAGEFTDQVSWSGYLAVGQVVRAGVSTNATTSTFESGITVSYAGSLKQVTVNANSRITIPTSELRFDGASTKGNGDGSTRVAFASIGLIRGDAFSTVTDATGTLVTMNKAGLLITSTTLQLTAAGVYVALICGSDSQIDMVSSASGYGTATLSKFVAVGDTIKVTSNGTLTGSNSSLKLSFQEQEIQVSVSNTLPQFSESDSCVRLSGGNGYGSTNLTTRRFASTIQNIGTDVQYIDSPTLGGQFIAQSSGIYNVSYSEESTTAGAESSIQLKVNGVLVAFDNQVYNTSAGISRHASLSWQGYLTIGDIVAANVSAAANNNGSTVLFTISKVGKPNVTGVNVTPFVNVPQPVTQNTTLVQTATFGIADITGNLTTTSGIGIYSYNSSTGIYTVLKRGTFAITALFTATAANICAPNIGVNGVPRGYNVSENGLGQSATANVSLELLVGDSFKTINSIGQCATQNITVLATASADTILTAPETFSTDTAALTYASFAAYTGTTLQNAPVGTYLTYTYAASTNTPIQTTTRPTQTDASMNADGILIYTRAFNATSTAAQPARVLIQIGKGLKGLNLNVYSAVGKTGELSFDQYVISTTIETGLYRTYNETTGILTLDVGYGAVSTNTSRFFNGIVDTSGYLVINASKNVSLIGMNIERVSASGRNSSGQSIPSNTATTMVYDATKRFDTNGALNAATGIFTCPETGYYQVSAGATFNALTPTAVNNVFTIRLYKNGTASTVLGYLFVETVAAAGRAVRGAEIISLNKGDTLSLSVFHNTTGAKTLTTSVEENYFSITKTNIGGKS